MPPRKKLRSSVSELGAPAQLTDSGKLYTLKEVLSAIAYEKKENKDCSMLALQQNVITQVKKKFLDANLELPLLSDDASVRRLAREIEISVQFERKHLSAKKKEKLSQQTL